MVAKIVINEMSGAHLCDDAVLSELAFVRWSRLQFPWNRHHLTQSLSLPQDDTKGCFPVKRLEGRKQFSYLFSLTRTNYQASHGKL